LRKAIDYALSFVFLWTSVDLLAWVMYCGTCFMACFVLWLPYYIDSGFRKI